MVVEEENEKWKIIRLELEHNHPLHLDYREQIFSEHNYMTKMEKEIIRTLTRKMISILSYLRGGVTALPYKKDVANFRTKLNRIITGSDMKQALNYFTEKIAKDPNFYYKFDIDEHLRVKKYILERC
jgi:pectate lyase